MLHARLLPLLFTIWLIASIGLCQTEGQLAPIPTDPLEAATGPVQVADTADQRASILALLERARQNNYLHAPGGVPFVLKVSFNSGGQSPYTGAGEMEEVWVAPGTWRWTAQLGDYAQTRVFRNGLAYDANPHAYLPLRLQMVRGAVFWPVAGNFAASLIRFASANWNGAQLSCALISGPRATATPTPGRRWQEEEFCIDPKSGLLQTYSVAPGIYNVYDYTNALQFHGRTLARQISIVENGSTVVQLQLNSIQDLSSVDESLFTPTPEMQGPGVIIRGPMRLAQFTPSGTDTSSGPIQPIIVHALLDVSGKVLEAEPLQTSQPSLSDAALQLVKNTNYGPPSERTRSPIQREVFVNVQFVPGRPGQ
jgi:hypothetical protein